LCPISYPPERLPIAFVSGFSERLFTDIISKTENIFSQGSLLPTTNPSSLPLTPEIPQNNNTQTLIKVIDEPSPLDDNESLGIMSKISSIPPVQIRGVWLANRPHSAVLESADNREARKIQSTSIMLQIIRHFFGKEMEKGG
jgi:hypothetical protein